MTNQQLARQSIAGARLLTSVRPLANRLDALGIDPAAYFQRLLTTLENVTTGAEAEALLTGQPSRRFEDMSDDELEALIRGDDYGR